MPTSCPTCRTPNADQARFCQNCGSTLGATNVHGRTVVHTPMGPPSPSAPSPAPPSMPTIARTYAAAMNAGTILPKTALGSSEQLVFVIDVSGSMDDVYDQRYKKIDAAKRAIVTSILEKARTNPGDQVALVSFDDQGQVDFPMTPLATGKSQLIQAVQDLQIRGGTDINQGLKVAGAQFNFSIVHIKRKAIILTDGQGGHPLRTAEDLKSKGVVIECIGIGEAPDQVDEALLRQIATTTNGECHYRFITDQRTLIDHVTRLGGQLT
jgi:Mg-chelatase subunit ChlD